MAHISVLGLFDYVTGKGDLTTAETEHLQECDDCRDELGRVATSCSRFPDIEIARHFLAEQGGQLPGYRRFRSGNQLRF